MCGGERRWAAHKERAAKEPSADGGSVDSRGLFSGGHLQGQALILIIRDALGTLRRAQSISIAPPSTGFYWLEWTVCPELSVAISVRSLR